LTVDETMLFDCKNRKVIFIVGDGSELKITASGAFKTLLRSRGLQRLLLASLSLNNCFQQQDCVK
jgi:hypothetical protein